MYPYFAGKENRTSTPKTKRPVDEELQTALQNKRQLKEAVAGKTLREKEKHLGVSYQNL